MRTLSDKCAKISKSLYGWYRFLFNGNDYHADRFQIVRDWSIFSIVNNQKNIRLMPVTRPYICQRTPTHGDTSDKLGARFIQVKSTSRTFFLSYANIHIVRNTVSNMSWLENCLIVELYVVKYAGVTPASMGPGL